WVRVRELAFTGVEPEILRLPALPTSGPLSGHLDNLNFPMGGDCLHLGLVSAIGEVQVAELGVIAVSGDGEQRVRLAGDLVSGEVTVLENSISGVLKVTLQPGPGGKGNFA